MGLAYKISSKTVFRAGYDMTYARRARRAAGRRPDRNGCTGFLGHPSFTSLDTTAPPTTGMRACRRTKRAPFFDPTLNTGFTTDKLRARRSPMATRRRRGILRDIRTGMPPAARRHFHPHRHSGLRWQQRPLPVRWTAWIMGRADSAEVHVNSATC